MYLIALELMWHGCELLKVLIVLNVFSLMLFSFFMLCIYNCLAMEYQDSSVHNQVFGNTGWLWPLCLNRKCVLVYWWHDSCETLEGKRLSKWVYSGMWAAWFVHEMIIVLYFQLAVLALQMCASMIKDCVQIWY